MSRALAARVGGGRRSPQRARAARPRTRVRASSLNKMCPGPATKGNQPAKRELVTRARPGCLGAVGQHEITGRRSSMWFFMVDVVRAAQGAVYTTQQRRSLRSFVSSSPSAVGKRRQTRLVRQLAEHSRVRAVHPVEPRHIQPKGLLCQKQLREKGKVRASRFGKKYTPPTLCI